MKASVFVPEGRIAPEDAVLDGFTARTNSELVNFGFTHTPVAKVSIQLAHTGRKASTLATCRALIVHFCSRSPLGFWSCQCTLAEGLSDSSPTCKATTEGDLQYVEMHL
jgi:hypothetical protein